MSIKQTKALICLSFKSDCNNKNIIVEPKKRGERQFKPQPNQFRNRKNWVRVWARSSWKTQTKTLDRTRKFLFRLFHGPETPINIDSFHSYRRSGTFKWPAFAEIAGKKSDFGPPRFLRRGVRLRNGVTKIL